MPTCIHPYTYQHIYTHTHVHTIAKAISKNSGVKDFIHVHNIIKMHKPLVKYDTTWQVLLKDNTSWQVLQMKKHVPAWLPNQKMIHLGR